MMGTEVGGQVGWLLPTACLLLVVGLWLARRERLAGATAALVVWGTWLLVTAATFSFMAGIFHAYYTVALAPAIAAIVGIGATLLWQRRDHFGNAVMLAVSTAVAAATSFILLNRTPDFYPWLRWVIAAAGITAALLLVAVRHLPRRATTAVAGLALAAVLAGPASYSLDTASTLHTGSIPTAGPVVADAFGGGMRRAQIGQLPGGRPGTGFPGGPPPGNGFPATGTGAGTGFPGTRTGTGGAGGGLLDSTTPSAALTKLLEAGSSDYTWVAAAIGSNNASGYQLATQLPVMPIGGFNGSDPSPTLSQFKSLIAAGKIHYFIAVGTGGGMSPGGSTSSAITSWVTSTFTSATVSGVTLYDLSGGVK